MGMGARFGAACLLGAMFTVCADAEQYRHGPVDMEGAITRVEWQPASERIVDPRPSPGNRRYAAHYEVALTPPSSPDLTLAVRLSLDRETGASLLQTGRLLRVNHYLEDGDEFLINVSYHEVAVTDPDGETQLLGPDSFTLFESIDGRDRGYGVPAVPETVERAPSAQTLLLGIVLAFVVGGGVAYAVSRRF